MTFEFQGHQKLKAIKNGLLCADGSVANFVFSIIHLDYAHINFAQLENIVTATGGTSSRERFWRKNTSQSREITLQVKKVMTSLSCNDNSDVNKTLIVANFRL